MQIRLIGTQLPGVRFGDYAGVRVGVQRGRDVVESVPGDAASADFEVPVRLVDGDFRGPYVHGRRGERFLYLVWTHEDDAGRPVMFRRAKLWLAPVADLAPGDDGTVEGRLGLTDACGGPLCASVRPPVISWRLV